MAGDTSIAWTEKSWNPVVGCSITSKGCKNCFAMRMAARLESMGVKHYAGLTEKVNGKAVWTGQVAMAPEKTLTQPLRWKKPRMIFVNSMGDLFHPSVPDEWIDRVFAVMALADQHTFQVLTKQAERMRDYFADEWRFALIEGNAQRIHFEQTGADPSLWLAVHDLPNVWLGVSAEDQKRADQRIPDLLDTPAAVRFVSIEPQLESIDITEWLHDSGCTIDPCNCAEPREDRIDWVICGAESGPGRRPFNENWARSLRDQCQDAGAAFFLKQMPGDTPKGVIETPELDGRRWVEMPGGANENSARPCG